LSGYYIGAKLFFSDILQKIKGSKSQSPSQKDREKKRQKANTKKGGTNKNNHEVERSTRAQKKEGVEKKQGGSGNKGG
jgi:hypothetical protein